jgi:hypothetical protein
MVKLDELVVETVKEEKKKDDSTYTKAEKQILYENN